MSDLSKLYKVNDGATVVDNDHNSLVDAVQAVDAEMNLLTRAAATYASATASTDGGWAGTKVDCEVNADSGQLWPKAGITWIQAEASMTWDTGVWDSQWLGPWHYLTQVIDLGAVYHGELTFTALGAFLAGNPTLEVHWSTNGTDWWVWEGEQTGATMATVRLPIRYVRVLITVPQAGYDPCYLSGLTWAIKGPRFRDAGHAEPSVGWNTIPFSVPFTQAPLIQVTPEWNAEQDVRYRIRNITTTGFDVALVLHDGTPINGRIAWEAVAR
jgi:hypothetical protein